MSKAQDKKDVAAKICAAAQKYKQNLVGRHFLYAFDGRFIEVAYQAKGFRHLTGVDTKLDAMSFYKKVVAGTLQASQIFFSAQHPYQLCTRKLKHLDEIVNLATSECFMLENITTETQSYQFGTTDLAFTLCMNRRPDEAGVYHTDKFSVESLRDEDGFARSEGAYTVTHILSKPNDSLQYTDIVYIDAQETLDTIPENARALLAEKLC